MTPGNERNWCSFKIGVEDKIEIFALWRYLVWSEDNFYSNVKDPLAIDLKAEEGNNSESLKHSGVSSVFVVFL